MTTTPPPPPPGGYGAPQPGGFGPPPGAPGAAGGPSGYQQPKTGFDFASVDRFDWGVIAAGVLALIFSLFSFYSYSPSDKISSEVSQAVAQCKSELEKQHLPTTPCDQVAQQTGAGRGPSSVDNSAWHGFFGWFGVLLLLIAAIAIALQVFAPQAVQNIPVRLAALGASALGLLFVVIALFAVPDGSYEGHTIPSDSSSVDAGHGFSYWIVLILAIAAVALCFLRFQQTGGQLPGMNKPSAAPGYPPAAGPPPQPPAPGQPGYGPPPPGYGAPQ